MKRRDIFRGALGLSLVGATLAASRPSSDPAGEKRFRGMTPEERRRHRFPNILLHTQDAKSVRFYDDLLKDKTVLINFMYTSCTDDCPLTTANLVQVQQALEPHLGRDFFMYSISVDPTHDTPAVLKKYATTFGVKPGWLFLTGTTEDIRALRKTFGDNPALNFRQSQHLNLLAYGIEPLERWGGCPALADPKWIVRYLAWLDPQGERPTGWWPAGHGITDAEDTVRS
ncbi:MAG TPA: SCO family protein [Candidatus Methylomirabilis sp.]|nr:SCO family protein [Candidatus Methylomirabilis sp.]